MNIWSDIMKWISNVINNQFLFYSFLALFCVGAIILFTLIYMDRRNLKLFKEEEKNLLDELEKEPEEEIKITQIVDKKEEKPKANLEEVLEKMQADLDKKEDVVAIFEQEQEEKAIISYQELLNSKNQASPATNKELLSVIEQIGPTEPQEENLSFDQKEDFKEDPILSTAYFAEEPYSYTDDDFSSYEELLSYEAPKKFKTTDFISPIYGKLENNIKYPKIPNFNELDKQTRAHSIEVDKKLDGMGENQNHNDAFLNALKEFRSHLE